MTATRTLERGLTFVFVDHGDVLRVISPSIGVYVWDFKVAMRKSGTPVLAVCRPKHPERPDDYD